MTILFVILKILFVVILVVVAFLLLLLFCPQFIIFELDSRQKLSISATVKIFLGFICIRLFFRDKKFDVEDSLFNGHIKLKLIPKLINKNSKKENTLKEKTEISKNGKAKRINLPKISISYISNVLHFLKYFFKVNKTRVTNLDGYFSLGEPDSTGMLCGGLSIIPIIYEDKVSLRPDFESEKSYFSGVISFKSTIFIFTLLVAFIKIKNKDI